MPADTNLPRIWDGAQYIDGPPLGGYTADRPVYQSDLTAALAGLGGGGGAGTDTTARTAAATAQSTADSKLLKGNVVTKTAAYTAVVGDVILADTTSATFTVTIPAASGGKGRIVVKWTAGTVAPTVALTGSDHVNTSGGVQSFAPTLLGQGYQLESDGAGLWAVTSDDLPLSKLDARYAPAGNYVAQTTKVNGHALSGDITLSAADVGAAPTGNYAAQATGSVTPAYQAGPELRFILTPVTGGTAFVPAMDTSRPYTPVTVAGATNTAGDLSLEVTAGGTTTLVENVAYSTVTSLPNHGYRGTASVSASGVTVTVESVVERVVRGVWRKTITLTASGACNARLWQGHAAPGNGNAYNPVTFEGYNLSPTEQTGQPFVGLLPAARPARAAGLFMLAHDGATNQWGRAPLHNLISGGTNGAVTSMGLFYGNGGTSGSGAIALAAGVSRRFTLTYFTTPSSTSEMRLRASHAHAVSAGFTDRDVFGQVLASTALSRLALSSPSSTTGAWTDPAGTYGTTCYTRDSWWTCMGIDDADVSRQLITRFAANINASNRAPTAMAVNSTTGSESVLIAYTDDSNALLLMWNYWHGQRWGVGVLTAAQITSLVAGITSNLDGSYRWKQDSNSQGAAWFDSLLVPQGSWSSPEMQGLTYVALQCAVASGATVSTTVLNGTKAAYQAFYRPAGYVAAVQDLSDGSYPYDWSYVGALSPDFWANYLLGESLLTDAQVASHLTRLFTLNATPLPRGGRAFKVIVDGAGAYLSTTFFKTFVPGDTGSKPAGGVYQNGGSWLLVDFIALATGALHGYNANSLQAMWEDRIAAEFSVEPESHEHINTSTAGAFGIGTTTPASFKFGWNVAILTLEPFSGLRRRRSEAIPTGSGVTQPSTAGAITTTAAPAVLVAPAVQYGPSTNPNWGTPPTITNGTTSPTAYDSFSRTVANASNLAGLDSGGVWTPIVGTWGTHADGTASVSPNISGGIALTPVPQATTAGDMDVSIAIAFSSTTLDTGVIARSDATAQNYVWADFEGGTQIRLIKMVGGTATPVTTATVSAVSTGVDHTLRLVVQGTTATVYYDGTAVISGATVPAGSGLYAGLRDGAQSGARNFDAFTAKGL